MQCLPHTGTVAEAGLRPDEYPTWLVQHTKIQSSRGCVCVWGGYTRRNVAGNSQVAMGPYSPAAAMGSVSVSRKAVRNRTLRGSLSTSAHSPHSSVTKFWPASTAVAHQGIKSLSTVVQLRYWTSPYQNGKMHGQPPVVYMASARAWRAGCEPLPGARACVGGCTTAFGSSARVANPYGLAPAVAALALTRSTATQTEVCVDL